LGHLFICLNKNKKKTFSPQELTVMFFNNSGGEQEERRCARIDRNILFYCVFLSLLLLSMSQKQFA